MTDTAAKDDACHLLPCPFCGKSASEHITFDVPVIDCTNKTCPIGPSTWLRCQSKDRSDTIKAWNTRAHMAKRPVVDEAIADAYDRGVRDGLYGEPDIDGLIAELEARIQENDARTDPYDATAFVENRGLKRAIAIVRRWAGRE